MSEPLIFMRHVRAANLCAGGARAWFRRNGFSWTDFLDNGIAVSRVRALNDEFGNRVAILAEREANNGKP